MKSEIGKRQQQESNNDFFGSLLDLAEFAIVDLCVKTYLSKSLNNNVFIHVAKDQVLWWCIIHYIMSEQKWKIR